MATPTLSATIRHATHVRYRAAMVTWDALDALSHAFELNGIDPSSSVVALLGDDERVTELVRAALARSRAEAIEVRPIRRGDAELDSLLSGDLLPSLLSNVEVVIDALGGPRAIDTPSNARVLRLLPAAADAHLRPPHANLAKRVSSLAGILGDAQELRLYDDNGTDLVIGLHGALVSSDGGRTDGAGSIAEYPSGWVRIVAAAGSVDGDLVLMPGDANLNRGIHLNSPIRLIVQDDRITDIEGESADADVLRALFEYLGNADAYGFASCGLGLNAGQVLGDAPFEDALLDDSLATLTAGVVRIAFGDNLHADRPCSGSVAMALARQSVDIDGVTICEAGTLVGDVAPDVYELPG